MATGRITQSDADEYETMINIFSPLYRELKEISKKKPDAVVSKFKVSQVNRVLEVAKKLLSQEPEHYYLDLLEDEDLPQVSDIVIVMSQYKGALTAYKERYHGYDSARGTYGWLVHHSS